MAPVKLRVHPNHLRLMRGGCGAAILDAFNPLSLDAVNFLLSDVRRALGLISTCTQQHGCYDYLARVSRFGAGACR
jgi:hypothetical protein